MSGQVADIISDSIKRKIAKVYGGSFNVFMFRRGEPRHPNIIVWEASERGGRGQPGDEHLLHVYYVTGTVQSAFDAPSN